jgi:flagellar hook-associated protein 3 FlgL
LPLSDIGPNVFGNIRTSATTFNALANSANTGVATITAAVHNPGGLPVLTGDNYSVKFTSATTFDVTDTTTGVVAAAAVPYTSGTPVTVAGIDITITNGASAPATGDKFTVQPGNQNIFETFTDVINALQSANTTTPQGQADLQAALGQANSNINVSLDNVSSTRTKLGSSLSEIDTLDSAGSQNGINLKATLSSIQDLDYAKAISQLSQQQLTLQAAQKSFLSTTQLSLFSLLP